MGIRFVTWEHFGDFLGRFRGGSVLGRIVSMGPQERGVVGGSWGMVSGGLQVYGVGGSSGEGVRGGLGCGGDVWGPNRSM